MPSVTSAGRRLHFQIDGSGDIVLMFANSLGTSLEMWSPQVNALASDFRILRYDNRGHGRSDPNDQPIDVVDLAADALMVMEAAGARQVHFVGLSLGGMIGQCLALSHPERLLSLTLCATAANLPPAEGWEQRALTALGKGTEPFVDISRGRWFTPGFCSASPDVVEGALAQLRQVDPASYAASCRAIRDFDLRESISEIAVPVQLIAGENDPSTPPAALAEIGKRVRGATMSTLSPAAHLLNLEQPTEVSRLIESFVRRQPAIGTVH